jgi:hypothetical protein
VHGLRSDPRASKVSKVYKTKSGRGLSADSFDTVYPSIKTCVLCSEASKTFDMLLVLGEGVAVLYGLCWQHMKLGPRERKAAVMSQL